MKESRWGFSQHPFGYDITGQAGGAGHLPVTRIVRRMRRQRCFSLLGHRGPLGWCQTCDYGRKRVATLVTQLKKVD